MENVIKIEQKALLNAEFFGMHSKFGTFTGVLTNANTTSAVAAYKAALEDLSRELDVATGETDAHVASRLNDDRLKSYSSFRFAVRALSTLKDATKASLGKSYLAIFESYSNPHDLSQDGASGVIDKIIETFRSHSKEELETAGVEAWLEQLESDESTYTNATQGRGNDRMTRAAAATQRFRKACTQKFLVLTELAHSLGESTGDAGCVSFINQVNGEIALRKEKLKMRKALAAKKKAESGESEAETVNAEKVETAASETATVNATAVENNAVETAKEAA